MKDKFKDLPVDEETQIFLSTEAKIGDYDVVYQKWHWGGIDAESIIFLNEDVEDLNEDEIIDEVAQCRALVNEDSQFTYKRGDKYTFVNFNFITK